MRLLYITSQSGRRINDFMRSALVAAHDEGLEIHFASNSNNADPELWASDCEKYHVISHNIPLVRTPWSPGNLKAISQMRELVRKLDPDIIHCNTPIGGIAGRIAATPRQAVLYQAHGFHFWKGAPVKNWAFYYPVEKLLARRTDILLTINHDDCELAKRKMSPRVGVRYVPGVGIRIRPQRLEYGTSAGYVKDKLGLPGESIVVLATGELRSNKNHELAIRAIAAVGDPHIHFAIMGQGGLKGELAELANSLGVSDIVHFLGFCTNVDDYYFGTDIFCMPSKREGLSVALMEAMSCGLPCVVSDIRGNRDLVEDGVSGLVCPQEIDAFANAISALAKDESLRAFYGKAASERVKDFSFEAARMAMRGVYAEMEAIAREKR